MALSASELLRRPLWIFDMDGTLTVPAHDFAGFRASQGLPADRDILDGIAGLPEAERAGVERALHDWEEEVAARAVAQDDAVRLLGDLRARGATLALLTRNTLRGAQITLRASGLGEWFPDPALVLGRTCAPAKPDPGGVELLAERAAKRAADAVMVGDWVHDVQAGRRAGAATVLIERHGPCPQDWRRWVDVAVADLRDLVVE